MHAFASLRIRAHTTINTRAHTQSDFCSHSSALLARGTRMPLVRLCLNGYVSREASYLHAQIQTCMHRGERVSFLFKRETEHHTWYQVWLGESAQRRDSPWDARRSFVGGARMPAPPLASRLCRRRWSIKLNLAQRRLVSSESHPSRIGRDSKPGPAARTRAVIILVICAETAVQTVLLGKDDMGWNFGSHLYKMYILWSIRIRLYVRSEQCGVSSKQCRWCSIYRSMEVVW